jgi:hypothetical protein
MSDTLNISFGGQIIELNVGFAAAAGAAVTAAAAATAAAEAAAASAEAAITAVVDTAASIGETDVSHASIGTNAPNALTIAEDTYFFAPLDAADADCLVVSWSARFLGATTFKLLGVDASGLVLWDRNESVSTSGIHTIVMGNEWLPSGGRVFCKWLSGSGLRYDVTGPDTSCYFASSAYSGVLGDTVAINPVNPVNLSALYEVAYTSGGSLQQQISGVGASVGVRGEMFGTLAPDTHSSSPNIYFASDDSPAQSGFLQAFTVRMGGPSAIRVLVVNAASIVTWDNTFSASATGANRITLSEPVAFPAGSHVYVNVISGAGLRYVEGGSSRTFPSSEYSGTVGDTVTETLGNPVSVSIQIEVGYEWTEAVAGILANVDGAVLDDRVISASYDIASMTLTTAATVSRNGVNSGVGDARAFTAATGSNVRYDMLYYNFATSAFGVLAGTERVEDAPEFIPTVTSAPLVPVFHVRVTASAITVVPVWNVSNGEDRSLTPWLDGMRARSRRSLRKTIERIRRGQSLRIVGFGDSITAIQSATPSSTVPNGASRDRAMATGTANTYLRDNIGDDVVNALPTYTAVQLGRSDDGAGSVHSRIGWNWSLVSALEAFGYVLGTDLFYDNFGVGSTATTAAVSGASPSAWTTAAVALGGHLAVISFGMNELGASTTEANLVIVVNAFKASGAEVVLMGCPRPRVGSVSDWALTNRAIERVARYTNSAFVPMTAIYNDEYIGAIGLASPDVCTANAINHPGLLEHSAIGRELAKLVLD